jgi:hypothetical protein
LDEKKEQVLEDLEKEADKRKRELLLKMQRAGANMSKED